MYNCVYSVYTLSLLSIYPFSPAVSIYPSIQTYPASSNLQQSQLFATSKSGTVPECASVFTTKSADLGDIITGTDPSISLANL